MFVLFNCACKKDMHMFFSESVYARKGRIYHIPLYLVQVNMALQGYRSWSRVKLQMFHLNLFASDA
jgi:hypothetical protein